jgi:hypothetical protein
LRKVVATLFSSVDGDALVAAAVLATVAAVGVAVVPAVAAEQPGRHVPEHHEAADPCVMALQSEFFRAHRIGSTACLGTIPAIAVDA